MCYRRWWQRRLHDSGMLWYALDCLNALFPPRPCSFSFCSSHRVFPYDWFLEYSLFNRRLILESVLKERRENRLLLLLTFLSPSFRILLVFCVSDEFISILSFSHLISRRWWISSQLYVSCCFGDTLFVRRDEYFASCKWTPWLSLVWHGRNSYNRSARLAQFTIHRGLIIAIIQAVFSALFFFAALPIYTGWLVVGFVMVLFLVFGRVDKRILLFLHYISWLRWIDSSDQFYFLLIIIFIFIIIIIMLFTIIAIIIVFVWISISISLSLSPVCIAMRLSSPCSLYFPWFWMSTSRMRLLLLIPNCTLNFWKEDGYLWRPFFYGSWFPSIKCVFPSFYDVSVSSLLIELNRRAYFAKKRDADVWNTDGGTGDPSMFYLSVLLSFLSGWVCFLHFPFI